ncbi:MAG: gluconate 2-dehydrogenase subunit 3 family protein [Pseudomonas sp.]
MKDRYPGYDVQLKRQGLSWNDVTRQTLDSRLQPAEQPRFFDQAQWDTLVALCQLIVPQPGDRPPVPLAALLDARVHGNHGEGYRDARLPPMQRAWTQGLAALDAEALSAHGQRLHTLTEDQQGALLQRAQRGEVRHAAWGSMPPALFVAERLLHDITAVYYTHPSAWNDIGFGGPASPRGYVRLAANRRDKWEASEAKPGSEAQARDANRRVR